MKNYSLLLLAFLFVISCKKKDEFKPNPVPEPAPLTDFLYLPVKDAEWRIHEQGHNDRYWEPTYYSCFEFADGKIDTASHRYYTIRSANFDTIMNGHRYYKFLLKIDHVYTRKPCVEYDTSRGFYSFYAREDTLKKQILFGAPYYESVVADFSSEQIGVPANVPERWPESSVSSITATVINGQKAKMWEVSYVHDNARKFFYQAYGIGDQFGILPDWMMWYGSEIVSLDFTYKGKTNHFDFDIHP